MAKSMFFFSLKGMKKWRWLRWHMIVNEHYCMQWVLLNKRAIYIFAIISQYSIKFDQKQNYGPCMHTCIIRVSPVIKRCCCYEMHMILWPFNLIIFHKTFLYMERIQQHFQLRFGYNKKKRDFLCGRLKEWIRVFWTLTFLHCLVRENVMRTWFNDNNNKMFKAHNIKWIWI